MTNAALYIRVSTQDQVENYSIETQKERLEAYCKAKNWSIYDVYIDGGYSGATTNRPELKRLLKDLSNIDNVVVYKLDRLSRSQKDTLELIEEHFLKNNVDFVSITETLDTSTPFGKAMIGILSVFAQLERETIAERMRMGHIKRAENGLRGMGGDYDPSGYERVNGHLVIKEDESKHIQRLFDLYEVYHSITRVQESLKEEGFKIWRFRRYRDILMNRLYIGEVSFAGKTYKGLHESIISNEQFERVQVLLSRHKGHNAYKAKASMLSGLVKCGTCGENYVAYSAQKGPHKYAYYICRARRFPVEYDHKCFNKTWRREKLEKLIIDELRNITFEKKMTNKQKKKKDYKKMLTQITKKTERLLKLYANENIDTELLDKQIKEYNLEKEKIINEKHKEDETKTTHINEKMLNDIHINFDGLEFKEKQSIINTFVKAIYVNEDDVRIDWRF